MKRLWSRLLSWVSWLVPSDEALEQLNPEYDAAVKARMLDEKRKWNARELGEKRTDQRRMAR